MKCIRIPVPETLGCFSSSKKYEELSVELDDTTEVLLWAQNTGWQVSLDKKSRSYLFRKDAHEGELCVGHHVGWAAALYRKEDGSLMLDTGPRMM